jgi:D-alanyl-lipoteichoic acid acyltransferase DltB (MBOAT superfamily)
MTLLLLLFAFKTAGWFLTEFLPRAGGSDSNSAVLVLAPLGLSYYVFKMVGYLLDVYWGKLPAQRNFVSTALYAAFFPQIVSGPIQRAGSFFDQIEKIKTPDPDQFMVGLRRILFGLVKKVAIADQLSVLVGNVHRDPSGFSPLELLAGAYCFSIQLYADFSGITDIAIGIGLLFGMKGPENFDLPYSSSNIQMFWRRWHMSLTTWLTDYLFTPLRMSLRNMGQVGLCVAIFINMIAIGLWHGLTWTYLAFGILNGIYMTVSALTLKRRNLFFKTRPRLAPIRAFAGPLLTFHLVVLSHIFFRAVTFPSALNYIAGLIPRWRGSAVPVIRFDPSLLGLSARALMLCVAAFLASEAVVWAMRQRFWIDWFAATPVFFRRVLYGALIAVVLLMFQGGVSFIYARF